MSANGGLVMSPVDRLLRAALAVAVIGSTAWLAAPAGAGTRRYEPIVSPCAQPVDPGPCEAAIPRWAFDRSQGGCLPFVYGGCGGNENNFASEAACLERCGGRIDVCELPADPGPCDAAIPRWFHDPAAGTCTPFVYGGCGGNANNFATLAECEAGCFAQPRCAQPIVPGPCRAAIPRWGFDAEKGACVPFTYGGCGGNDNNFATREACERGCPACDDALCDEHQTCRLYRDPACREREERCRRLCAEDCNLHCDAVPLCIDECEPGACPEGTRCELVPVQCIRPPCPPVRHCVPDQDPCATIRCGAYKVCRVYEPTGEPYCADVCAPGACPQGTFCKLEEVTCVRAPCPPVRTCVEGPDPCSKLQCVRWQHCVTNEAGRPICVPN
jgi:hypothetical protein